MLTADLATDLIAIDARKHQVEQHQVWLIGFKCGKSFFPVVYDHRIEAFLCKVERNQFCNILVIIYN